MEDQQASIAGPSNQQASEDLLSEFRLYFRRILSAVQQLRTGSYDSVVLARIGDQLDSYLHLVNEYVHIFEPAEHHTITTNISLMQTDVRLLYGQALDESHSGRPEIVASVPTGGRGRPRLEIDPDFLRWASSIRTTAGISRFLGLSRRTVRAALLQNGLAAPGVDPFPQEHLDAGVPAPASNELLLADTSGGSVDETNHDDELLDPILSEEQLQEAVVRTSRIPQPTDSAAVVSDSTLDTFLAALRGQFRRAGVTILHGLLRSRGLSIPRERIRLSLLRIDPVHRIFQRITIRRRTYSVPGPMALWHHDGQHGLIRWRIIIHGFIDGYSRLVVALRASGSNTAQTVLNLFLEAAAIYGVPSRLRGDHGTENILVAAFMEAFRGERRGSYIWGRSVHNVRIERLWGDVTIQIGAYWHGEFMQLEVNFGLNIHSNYHIWLLHFLFLGTINEQLDAFVQGWNHHIIRIRDGPSRSPLDMFGFDMYIHGVRGTDLLLSSEELEVFGVDWEALREDRVLDEQRRNNPADEPSGSWIGQTGPPDHLNSVPVEEVPHFDEEVHPALSLMIHDIRLWLDDNPQSTVSEIWVFALAIARRYFANVF